MRKDVLTILARPGRGWGPISISSVFCNGRAAAAGGASPRGAEPDQSSSRAFTPRPLMRPWFRRATASRAMSRATAT
jgi:hypothetical protein